MGPGGRTLSWMWIGRSRSCGERTAIVVRTRLSRKWACSQRRDTTITLKGLRLILILKDVLAKLIITCTLQISRPRRSGLVEGYITSFDDPVSLKNKNMIASRLKSIAKKNAIRAPRLELIKISLLQNKASATKSTQVGYPGLSTKPLLIRSFLHERAKENAVGDIVCGVDRFGPKTPRSPMLIEHRPGHLH